MTKERNLQRWIPSLITALALAASTSLCQAQSPIILSNDSSQSPAFYDGGSPSNPGGTVSNWWQNTGGPNGGGCIGYYIDGTNDQEIDPAFNVAFNSAQYYQATVQMMVAPGSGTVGPGGSGGYGHSQLSFRDVNYSWNGVGYAAIFPPLANTWVTYTYAVPGLANPVAHLQLQLQGGGAYSGPVTVYIGNVTISPLPNPLVLSAFTNDVVSANWQNYGLAASWDSSVDSPYVNPVTSGGPTTITPAGSVEFQASSPTNYQGGQLNMGFNPSLFQSVAFDLYYDGPTPANGDWGGFQIFIANGSSPYNWAFIGNANFTAGMVGQWTHFNMPCASSGINNAAGFAIQSTPGTVSGTTPITFHIDNIQVWNPTTHPIISGLTPGTPGGVQMTLDGNGNTNLNDQEGITSPATNNANTDYFWMNQTPATYSFTLTNFPSPASAPSFSSHIYLCNGDTITTFNNLFGYNQTYSGAPFNMVDYLGVQVQNGTNGGVVAIVDWKTNAPNSNATNTITFNFRRWPAPTALGPLTSVITRTEQWWRPMAR